MKNQLMDKHVLAGTGHRPNRLGNDYKMKSPLVNWIRNETMKVVQNEKPDFIISGMALGFDTILALVSLDMDIPLIAAVPFKGQECKWPKESQDLYLDILSKAAEIVYVSDGGYSPAKMQVRNCWMADNSNVVLSCWNGLAGGTGNCVKYVEKINRRMIRINPEDFYDHN